MPLLALHLLNHMISDSQWSRFVEATKVDPRKFCLKMDLLEDIFGLTDSEEKDFEGFNAEDVERLVARFESDSDGESIDGEAVLQAEDLQWGREAPVVEEPPFHPFFGPRNVPLKQSTLGFFEIIFIPEIFELIVQQTNLYAMQENENKENKDPDWFDGNGEQNRSQSKRPKLSSVYLFRWPSFVCRRINVIGTKTSQSEIAKVFRTNRLLAILRYLHLNGNSNIPQRNDPASKLYRVQPFLYLIKRSIISGFEQYFPVKRELSIDEAMIKYKGR